jgi:hypothetical protein
MGRGEEREENKRKEEGETRNFPKCLTNEMVYQLFLFKDSFLDLAGNV